MNDSFVGLLQGLIGWLSDPAHWQGSNGIVERILEHVFYMLVSTLAGALIALPIGIGLGHSGRGGLLAINLANIGRAVPSFGVIIFVFLLVGYGVIPVIVALVALAIPPMVTNSLVGMRNVDPAVRQAATAVGMTNWQQLWRVELPIAMPLIMAGVRTSAVQVMSTATLAAYVGLGGLGRYLIDGLAVRDLVQVLVGAVLVAILAIATELAFAGLQRLVTARGLRHH
ncbi:ABC transporter permease [Kushneria phosphatilytica]|uniref:ABC transporter permease n=1 Tax=Kushneria phosphatilytica TaxID=657387 RepID=A0A1S1NUW9_9GAMM|nr:ABC transporter permease [Kushneria phosphatilytica]OHV10520.1 ABC transporter permease [Kushneria phosphatilytica]QEL11916.1 ABC transporter permease [Kushneria phosphatilytica]